MREKLLDLMKNEGLKSSQLAELLEINPAGISHILAGRNKPGFDLLQKILRRFPRINPDWLLLDSDQMYRDGHDGPSDRSASGSSSEQMIPDDLFRETTGLPAQASRQNPDQPAPKSPLPEAIAQFPGSRNDAAVRRIIVLYDDQTFESFTPTKR